jgi:hypothetical protein
MGTLHFRGIQFRLRSLFLVVAIICAPLAWLSWIMQMKRTEREAVAALERLGGEVLYDWQVGEDLLPLKAPTPRGPAWLRTVFGDDILTRPLVVSLPSEWVFANSASDGAIGDNDLGLLEDLPRLRALTVYSSNVTDDGLKVLARLTGIQRLSLLTPRITVATLAELQLLPELDTLSLSHCKLSGEDILHVSKLQGLKRLELEGAELTDADILPLASITGLRELTVSSPSVSQEVRRKLSAALPGCAVLIQRVGWTQVPE